MLHIKFYIYERKMFMAEKDISQKKLADFVDVFADIVNVLLFHGAQRVHGQHLRNALPRSIYKVEGKISEQERDLAKYWRDDSTCFALVGLENQSTIEKQMPLRVISYDGADYRAQVRKRQDIQRENARLKEEERKQPLPDFYPVITLVLYFGLERWNKPRNLKSCIKIPEGLEDYVNDYQIQLFEIAFLEDSTVSQFKSDFRLVAEYFVQSRKIKEGIISDYRLSMQELIHVKEITDLMTALTGDHSFEESYNKSLEEGGKSMWTLVDYIREQADERAEREKARAEKAETELQKAETELQKLETRAEKAEAELQKAKALIAEMQKKIPSQQ